MAGGPSPRRNSPTSTSTQSAHNSSTLTSSAASSSTGTADTSPPSVPALTPLGKSTYSQQQPQHLPLLSAPSSATSLRTGGMTAEVAHSAHPLTSSHFVLSSISEKNILEHSNINTTRSSSSLLGFTRLEPTMSNPESKDYLPSILIRRLPRSISAETLQTMLLFAKDLIDVNFVEVEQVDEHGLTTAVARFKSLAGAQEAKDRLHGKALAGDVQLAVDLHPQGVISSLVRRNTVDGIGLRNNTSSASLASLNGNGRSRYNNTFQTLERLSPPAESFAGQLDANSHIQSLFSPQSPIGNNAMSSKSIINDDPSDETGRLLNDPIGFAKSGESQAAAAAGRRTTNTQIPISRFAGLSLNTVHGQPGGRSNIASPSISGFVSPRSNSTSHTPASAMSPTGMAGRHPFEASNQYGLPSPHINYGRHNYPPANPADQNPPCNTLYVGNLPMDTSEDELKAVFSKQRGYKRLCFRTKQNGPMCFVEFEDISCATRALNELYGHPLHNSVKGGIRLSFSKNPLGVRNGQSAAQGLGGPLMGPNGMMGMVGSPLSPQTAGGFGMQGVYGNGTTGVMNAPPGFGSAVPPPGLSAPPGLAGPAALGSIGASSPAGFGVYASTGPVSRNGLGVGATYQGMMGTEFANYMGR